VYSHNAAEPSDVLDDFRLFAQVKKVSGKSGQDSLPHYRYDPRRLKRGKEI
jgi:hypothetical protein